MKARKNALEWTVFGVSLVIFVAIVGFLVVDAISGGAGAPQVEIHAGEPKPQGDRWAIPLTITNRGDKTAEGVQFEVALLKDGADVEVAEVSVAFLPRKSDRKASVLFRADPRDLQIVPRAISFEQP